MSRRLVHVVGDKAVRCVKIYRDNETDEYVCRLYLNGQLMPEADYFESFNRYDKMDVIDKCNSAIITAKALLND